MLKITVDLISLMLIFFVINSVNCHDTRNRNQGNTANDYRITLRGSCQQYGHACLGGHGKRFYNSPINPLSLSSLDPMKTREEDNIWSSKVRSSYDPDRDPPLFSGLQTGRSKLYQNPSSSSGEVKIPSGPFPFLFQQPQLN